MKRAAVIALAAFMLSGCFLGLLDYDVPANLYIENDYAESLFTLEYSLNGDDYVAICEDLRVSAYQTVRLEDTPTFTDADEVVFRMSVMSLGITTTFSGIAYNHTQTTFRYWYDLATAQFVLSVI